MNFLKKVFNDNSTIVGLCAFEQLKPKYCKNDLKHNFYFNPYQFEPNWETKLEANVLL